MYHLIWFTVPGQTPPECSFFAAPATVCKLAEINANDLDKVLNLTSPGLLCSLPKTEHRTNEIKCVLGRKRYMTTMASLRSICLNDLYRHKDLWEFAVEGDIHGVVPVLQMSVPWMPNGRKRSRGKWGDAPLLTSSGKRYQVWEKGFYSLVSSLLRRQPKHFGLVFLSYHPNHGVE